MWERAKLPEKRFPEPYYHCPYCGCHEVQFVTSGVDEALCLYCGEELKFGGVHDYLNANVYYVSPW
jgi:hypothetical protein